jgi:DNA-binding transcriptional ArsR family regulator
MDAMLQALANGTRRGILALVWRNERTAGEIASHFTMSRPGISQHLGVLLASSLVVLRRAGTRRLYRANRRAIAQLLAELGAFWDMSLAKLKDQAEAAERKQRRR